MICIVTANADGGNAYTIVDDDITEVVYRSPKDVVCRRTRQITCLCATRRTSIYKGLATLPYKCSRNCQ